MSKVLFIDDSQLVIKTVNKLIINSGHQGVSATSGIDGLCDMVEQEPDIIFIKANVAKLDGFQFCALVKGNAEYSHIPIIIVLDKDDLWQRSKALALGAESVLNKPFGKKELLRLFSKWEDKVA